MQYNTDSDYNSSYTIGLGCNNCSSSDTSKDNDIGSFLPSFFFKTNSLNAIIVFFTNRNMTVPILKDNDLCCPNCGVVFDYQKEFIHNENRPTKSNLHLLLLGSALSPKNGYHFNEDRDLRLKENMLMFLNDLCKRYCISEIIGHTVWLELLRKNRGHRSQDNAIALRQFIKLLSKDDYYQYHKKLALIKKDYEQLLNR